MKRTLVRVIVGIVFGVQFMPLADEVVQTGASALKFLLIL